MSMIERLREKLESVYVAPDILERAEAFQGYMSEEARDEYIAHNINDLAQEYDAHDDCVATDDAYDYVCRNYDIVDSDNVAEVAANNYTPQEIFGDDVFSNWASDMELYTLEQVVDTFHPDDVFPMDELVSRILDVANKETKAYMRRELALE